MPLTLSPCSAIVFSFKHPLVLPGVSYHPHIFSPPAHVQMPYGVFVAFAFQVLDLCHKLLKVLASLFVKIVVFTGVSQIDFCLLTVIFDILYTEREHRERLCTYSLNYLPYLPSGAQSSIQFQKIKTCKWQKSPIYSHQTETSAARPLKDPTTKMI